MANLSIKVRNVAGVERADLEGDGILLLAGPNGAGKSSTRIAVGAALTGVTIPYDELTKGQGGILVRTGTEKGGVQVTLPNGSATVHWPDAKLKTEGGPPACTTIPAGLLDLFTLNTRDRARELARIIDADPTKEQLAAALKDAGIVPPPRKEGESDADYAKRNVVEKVWLATQEQGWDAAWERAKKLGQELKLQFKTATAGETWGSDKGGKWLPSGWSDDLASLTLDGLEAATRSANEGVEAAVAGKAVDARELERLQGEAAPAESLKQQLAEANGKIEPARETLETARAARAALPPAENESGVPCPHCGEPVRMTQIKLGEWNIEKVAKKKLTDAELKKRRMAITDAEGEVTQAQRGLEAAQAEATRLRTAVDGANFAADALKKHAGKTGSQDAVDAARAELRQAEARIAAFKAKAEANKLHAAISLNQAIVACLAPEGLRKVTLTRALEDFNAKRLKPLCDIAGWKAVEINEDLNLAYGGRVFPLSDGEKIRVRATLQVAVAQIDKSPVIVIDAVGELDTAGRNGLFKLLRHWGGSAIVAAWFAKPDQVPDLAKAKMGRSFWFEKGLAVPLEVALEAERRAA